MAANQTLKKKENLKWKINVLEAQIGLEPEIALAKVALRKQLKHSTEDRSGSTNTDADANTELSENGKLSEKINQLKAEKISRKMFHSRKELIKAFKMAKALENQRLMKHLRNSRGSIHRDDNSAEDVTSENPSRRQVSSADVKKFEEELKIVKNLDLTSFPAAILHAKLSKYGPLKSHPAVQYYLSITPAPTSPILDQASKDAESRLMNIKVVKEALGKILGELQRVVLGKKRGGEGGRGDEEDFTVLEKEENVFNRKRKFGLNKDEKCDAHDDGNDGDDSGNSEDSGDGDSTSSGDEDAQSNTSKKQRLSANNERGRDRKLQMATPAPAIPRNKTLKSSMFLTSLNSGYTRGSGSSEEEWDDPNFDKYYGTLASGEKKRRKGQNARHIEYERKYGMEANHIKLWKNEKKAYSGRVNDRFRSRFNGPSNPLLHKGSLHPSWEAKRRQQETLSASMSRGASGKRIVYGDDGEVAAAGHVAGRHEEVEAKKTLHPSWEAKQLQKKAMARALAGGYAPVNKKIKFDNSDDD